MVGTGVQAHNIPANVKRIIPVDHSFREAAVRPVVIRKRDEAYDWLSSIQAGDVLAVDLETTGLDPHRNDITVIGISKNGQEVAIFLDDSIGSSLSNQVLFNNIMEDAAIRKVFHNAKFDMKFLITKYGTDFRNTDCTYIMRRLLVCGLDQASSLDACSYDYLGYKMDKTVRASFIGQTTISEEMIRYAAIDVAATWAILPVLDAYIDAEQLRPVYQNIERPLVRVVAKMEVKGVGIDPVYLKELEDVLVPKLDEYQADLDNYLKVLRVMPKVERKLKSDEKTIDHLKDGITHVIDWAPSINVNSPEQVLGVLQRMGLTITSSDAKTLSAPTWTAASLAEARKTFRRDLADDAILELIDDVIERILNIRAASKALGTYVRPLQKVITPEKILFQSTKKPGQKLDPKYQSYIHEITGRVHCDFGQVSTDTGRFSCSDPNLQNQITDEKMDKIAKGLSLRKAFRPLPGFVFITFDYAGCELRILGEITGDPGLIGNMNQDAVDPHRYNASIMYKVPPDEITKTQRGAAKNGIYGKVYGIGKTKLAFTLRVSESEAGRILETFDKAFPKMKRWSDARKQMAVDKGYSVSMAGRRRYYDTPRNSYERSAIERQGVNMPIQATNADITKLAMVFVEDAVRPFGAYLVLSIHDELVIECPEDAAEEVSKIVEREMLRAEAEFLRVVKCKVDGGYGPYWGH